MGLQHRLHATLPSVEQARRNHREAVTKERKAIAALDAQLELVAENRAAAKTATAERQRAEDELAEAEAVAAAVKGEHRA